MSQNRENYDTAPSDESEPFAKLSLRLIADGFEEEFGHGWKRLFATVVGVPESTVHSWLKAERLPPLVSRNLKLMIERNRARREAALIADQIADFHRMMQVVRLEDGYAVLKRAHDQDTPSHPREVSADREDYAEIHARGIQNYRDACKIAALPRLESIAREMCDLVEELIEVETYDEVPNVLALPEELQSWSEPRTLDAPKVPPELSDAVAAIDELISQAKAEKGKMSEKSKSNRRPKPVR